MAPFAKLSATLYSVCCSIFLTLLISKFGLLLLLYLFLGQNVEEEKTSQELTAEALYLNPEDFHRVNLREKKKRNRGLLPWWKAYWSSTCYCANYLSSFLLLWVSIWLHRNPQPNFTRAFMLRFPLPSYDSAVTAWCMEQAAATCLTGSSLHQWQTPARSQRQTVKNKHGMNWK